MYQKTLTSFYAFTSKLLKYDCSFTVCSTPTILHFSSCIYLSILHFINLQSSSLSLFESLRICSNPISAVFSTSLMLLSIIKNQIYLPITGAPNGNYVSIIFLNFALEFIGFKYNKLTISYYTKLIDAIIVPLNLQIFYNLLYNSIYPHS